MEILLLNILIWLNWKHLLADWIFQTDDMIKYKGIYGNWRGALHSILHAIFTLLVFWYFVSFEIGIIFFVVDFLLHYHIDWLKMRFGCQDIKSERFWYWIGFDQFLHHACYIMYAFLVGVV